MALAPVEIRHVKLGRGIFGYSRTAADRLLDEIATSFEDVWRERADLLDKVEQLEADLIVGEAHSEARGITRQAIADNERLQADSSRVRALLKAALATIEVSGAEEASEDEAPRAEAA